MTAEEFAKGFYLEKQYLIDLYFDPNIKSDVTDLIESMNLDDKQKERLRQILHGVLRDTMYSILLGLDGEANIGGEQNIYKLLDEENNDVTACGELTGHAYAYFHDNQFQINKGEADFIATLTYFTPEQGGRSQPAFSGYRPQIKFSFSNMMTSGQQTFIDRKVVYPGDTVEAEIKVLSVDLFANQLKERMKFDFREGSAIIGTGQIKHIINKKLSKPD
jgi:Elongation factor Tu C-terminal domain